MENFKTKYLILIINIIRVFSFIDDMNVKSIDSLGKKAYIQGE